MKHVPFSRRFAAWGDDLMGYGKPKSKWQWWMDLEEVDGELRIPESRNKGKVIEDWFEGPGE